MKIKTVNNPVVPELIGISFSNMAIAISPKDAAQLSKEIDAESTSVYGVTQVMKYSGFSFEVERPR